MGSGALAGPAGTEGAGLGQTPSIASLTLRLPTARLAASRKARLEHSLHPFGRLLVEADALIDLFGVGRAVGRRQLNLRALEDWKELLNGAIEHSGARTAS
jgi:hypothetical protein